MAAVEAWNSMGWAARVILTLLLAFAVLLCYVVAERVVTYRRVSRASGSSALVERQLQRHLHALAAIKVTAPMLGLLGTLLGLINAFAGMALTGQVDARSVGAGVAEALVTTVLGLAIGLPAWWADSFLGAWRERILGER